MRLQVGVSVTVLMLGLLVGCQNGGGGGAVQPAVNTPTGAGDAPTPGLGGSPGSTSGGGTAPQTAVLKQTFADGSHAYFDPQTREVKIAPPSLQAELRFDRTCCQTMSPDINWLDMRDGDSWRKRCESQRSVIDTYLIDLENDLGNGGDGGLAMRQIRRHADKGTILVGFISGKIKNLFTDDEATRIFNANKDTLSDQWRTAVAVRGVRQQDFEPLASLFDRKSMSVLQDPVGPLEVASLLTHRFGTSVNQFCDLLTGHVKHIAPLYGDMLKLELSESLEGSRPQRKN